MSLVIHNPYAPSPLPWLKGNLHTHTTRSDGSKPPQETVDAYAALGYDFLMLSDHDTLADTASVDGRGMTLLPGNEISANGVHMLHVGARTEVPPHADRQAVIDAVNADGGFAIVAHPNWEKDFNHCPQEHLETWQDYAGIEIYNGVVRWLRGSALATDRWDRLLGQGRKVWGYANDDCHREGNYGLAWNMVQTGSRAPEAILEGLRKGRFYASTGAEINRIDVEGRTIRVETENGQRLAVLSDFGYREAEADAAAIAFTVPEDAHYRYVRIQCWGPGETMAWTQPFFIEQA